MGRPVPRYKERTLRALYTGTLRWDGIDAEATQPSQEEAPATLYIQSGWVRRQQMAALKSPRKPMLELQSVFTTGGS